MNKLTENMLPGEARVLEQAIVVDAVLEAINEYGPLKFAQQIPDHAEAMAEKA